MRLPRDGVASSTDERLVVQGELLRTNLGPFRRGLERLAVSEAMQVEVDMRDCHYMSSLIIGQLVDGVLQCKERGKQVHVIVSLQIGKFFEQAHLQHLFEFEVAPLSPSASGKAPALT